MKLSKLLLSVSILLLLSSSSFANVVGFLSQSYTHSNEKYMMSDVGNELAPSSFLIRYTEAKLYNEIPYAFSFGILNHDGFDEAIPLASLTVPWYGSSCSPCTRHQFNIGRISHSLGFFNDILSSPSSHGMVIAPMGVYNRTFLASSWFLLDGISYTNFFANGKIENEFHTAYGKPVVTHNQKLQDIFFKYAPTHTLDIQPNYLFKAINSFTYDYTHTFLLQYYKQQLEAKTTGENPQYPFDFFIMQEPKVDMEAYFIGYRYQKNSVEFATEAFTLYTHHETSFGFSDGYKQTYGYYYFGRYNLDRASFFLGYTHSPGEVRKKYRNVNNVPSHYTYGKDTFFGMSYRATNNITLTAEHHMLEGTSWIPQKVDNDKYWNMTIFSLTYNF